MLDTTDRLVRPAQLDEMSAQAPKRPTVKLGCQRDAGHRARHARHGHEVAAPLDPAVRDVGREKGVHEQPNERRDAREGHEVHPVP